MEDGSTSEPPGRGWFQRRPGRMWRALARSPLYLYRLRLGWLMGHRFLVLTHRGRKTGRLRQTVLEVVRYDPRTREVVVAAGWGSRADWYRNLQVSPAVEILIAGDRYTPEQRFLSVEEVDAVLRDYVCRHTRTARLFARLFGFPLLGSDAERREGAAALPMVAFRPVPRVAAP